jgi:hypothetical protein
MAQENIIPAWRLSIRNLLSLGPLGRLQPFSEPKMGKDFFKCCLQLVMRLCSPPWAYGRTPVWLQHLSSKSYTIWRLFVFLSRQIVATWNKEMLSRREFHDSKEENRDKEKEEVICWNVRLLERKSAVR